MNKFFKTLTAIAVVIMIVCCLGVFVACDDTPNTDDNNGTEEAYVFKFTVKDSDDNVVEGIKVQLCSVSTGSCYSPKKTDANGVVKFYEDGPDYMTAEECEIHILLTSDQEAVYSFDNTKLKTSADKKDYTLELTKKAA